MITTEDIKYELRIPLENTSDDIAIYRTIMRVQELIKSYCNNENIDFETALDLDDIVLYLCIQRLNPETRHRAGKTGENQGFSISYLTDLPKEYKKALIKHRRLTFL